MKQSVTGWEDLSGYRLDNEAATEPLDRQTECTFVWVGTGRHPIRAVVDYLFRDGRFWVSATDRRPRVAAVRSDPRASLVVSSKGSGIADPPLAHLPGLSPSTSAGTRRAASSTWSPGATTTHCAVPPTAGASPTAR